MQQPKITNFQYLLARLSEMIEPEEDWQKHPCEVWPFQVSSHGHGRVWHENYSHSVHRLAYTIRLSPVKPSDDVGWKCGNRLCFRLSHLEVVPNRVEYIQAITLSFEDDPLADWTTYPCFDYPFVKNDSGYGTVMVNGKWQRATRVAYETKWGPFDKKLHVLHRCDRPPCFRWSHLWLGTPQDNNDDMMAKGRHNPNCGERAWNAKYTWEQVREMRAMGVAGVPRKEIAKRFSVNEVTLGFILTYRSWREAR